MAYVDESGVTTLTNEIKNYIQTYFLDLHYPVGSIYLSVNSTSPATLFGGTWEQIQDTFLLAAGQTYTAGATGGEATHTLTVDEMPSHKHDLERQQWRSADAVKNTGTGAIYNWRSGEGTGGSTSKSYHDSATSSYIYYTGGNGAHNNMPPYLVVYMWRRAA